MIASEKYFHDSKGNPGSHRASIQEGSSQKGKKAAVFRYEPNTSYSCRVLECLFKFILFQRYRVGIKPGVRQRQKTLRTDRQLWFCNLVVPLPTVSRWFWFHVTGFSTSPAEFIRTFTVYLRGSPEMVSTRLNETIKDHTFLILFFSILRHIPSPSLMIAIRLTKLPVSLPLLITPKVWSNRDKA